MVDFIEIFKKNRDTFYNYATGDPTPVRKRYFLILVVSGLASIFTNTMETHFLTSVISVQSILAGFSFSVLFFITSARKIEYPIKASIEKRQKVDKVNDLLGEIFQNISYFNLISLLSIAIILVNLISLSDIFSKTISVITPSSIWPVLIGQAAGYVSKFMIFCAIIETLLTFFRIGRRVNYLFEQMRKI